MRLVRAFGLAAMLAGLVWFGFFNSASAREVAGLAWDSFDSRPARSILFVGNSRTYPHDMPYMVRRMADSANAPEKYQVRMHALPGESFEEHWNNSRVRGLIAEGFDDIVLQESSGAHWREARAAEFLRYGELLVADAAAHGARPILFVGWNYGPPAFRDEPPGAEAGYYGRMQDDHLRLARLSGARRANVGETWRAVLAADPPFRLERDGNHPTPHGSYLAALVFYAHLSGRGVADVSYVPSGLSPEDAALLRRLVGSALGAAG